MDARSDWPAAPDACDTSGSGQWTAVSRAQIIFYLLALLVVLSMVLAVLPHPR
jgi:predicted nucleic acid-binding Zn ribbon protein